MSSHRKIAYTFMLCLFITATGVRGDFEDVDQRDIIRYPVFGFDLGVGNYEIIFQTFFQLAMNTNWQKFVHEATDITTYVELTLPGGWDSQMLDVYAVFDGLAEYHYYDSGDPNNNIQLEWADDHIWNAVYGHCVLQEAWQPPDSNSGFTVLGISDGGGIVCDHQEEVEEGDRLGFVSRATFYQVKGGHSHFEMWNSSDDQCYDPLLCDRSRKLYCSPGDQARPDFFEDEPEGRFDDEDELIGYKIPVDDQVLATSRNNMIVYWETLPWDSDADCIKSRQTLLLDPDGYVYWDDYLETVDEEDHRIFTVDSEPNVIGYLDHPLIHYINENNHTTYLYIDDVGSVTEYWIRAYDADGKKNKILIPNDNIAAIPFVASIEKESGEGKVHLEIVENEYFDERARFSIYNGGIEDDCLLTDEPVPLIRGKDKYKIGGFVETFEDAPFYSLLIEVPGDGNYVFRIEEGKCECIDWYK